MNRLSLSLTRAASFTVALVAAAGLSGCASLVNPVPLSELLEPLDMALQQPPADLASRARAGDGKAQLAMSIVAGHGLNGSARDARMATDWLAQAVANRRTVPITQYTAAFDGQSSRVNLIYVPVAAVPAAQFEAVERCVGELARDIQPAPACGDDVATQTSRREAWIVATP